MKCLTRAESAAFWKDHEYLVRNSDATTDSFKQRIFRRRIDANIEQKWPGKTPWLGRALAHWLWWGGNLSPENSAFVEVFEWGIAEFGDYNLYYAWRQARGGDRGLLQDAPGHHFLEFERQDCPSLLFMGLTYCWGLSCASPHCGRAFHVNHDGHGILIAHSESDLDSGAKIYGHSAPPWGVRTPAS